MELEYADLLTIFFPRLTLRTTTFQTDILKKVSPFLRKVISLIKEMTFNWYFYLAFEIGLKSALKRMLWRLARY